MAISRRRFLVLGGGLAGVAAAPAWLVTPRTRPAVRWVASGPAQMPTGDLPTLLLNRAAFGGAAADLARRPTPAEIAARMEVSEGQVRQMLRISRRSLSLEKPVGEEQDSEFGQFIEDALAPDPLEDAAQILLHHDIDEMLQCLTAREARILRLRYGLDTGRPHTLKEVGRKFNLTRERIRQIEQEALHKLRHPERRARLISYLH